MRVDCPPARIIRATFPSRREFIPSMTYLRFSTSERLLSLMHYRIKRPLLWLLPLEDAYRAPYRISLPYCSSTCWSASRENRSRCLQSIAISSWKHMHLLVQPCSLTVRNVTRIHVLKHMFLMRSLECSLNTLRNAHACSLSCFLLLAKEVGIFCFPLDSW